MSLNSLRASPLLLVVMSPMYSPAPIGESACCSRKTVKSVFGGRPLAVTSKSSKPTRSVFSSTLMLTFALGMHLASAAEEGVRCSATDGTADDAADAAPSDGAAVLTSVAVVRPAARAPQVSRPVVSRFLIFTLVLLFGADVWTTSSLRPNRWRNRMVPHGESLGGVSGSRGSRLASANLAGPNGPGDQVSYGTCGRRNFPTYVSQRSLTATKAGSTVARGCDLWCWLWLRFRC